MKKQFIIIGIIILLICVGLSGCAENKTGPSLTDIGDIAANPQNYVNKTVTVEGICTAGAIISDSSGHEVGIRYSTILNGSYRLTGIVRIQYSTLVYIEVLSAEST